MLNTENLLDSSEFLHFKIVEDSNKDDDGRDPILPRQPPTVSRKITDLTVSCNQPGCPTFSLKLAVDAAPGCGGVAWPAGCNFHAVYPSFCFKVLANYLSSRKTLRGLSVVELGSGTGLVGIVAGLMQAESVWITDQEPLLELMRTNVELNGLSANVKVTQLDWGSDIPVSIPRQPDLVLAADCVYFEPAFGLLVSTLSILTTSPKTEVLFCYKKRRKADKRFFTLLKKVFTWEVVTNDPMREDYNRDGVYLYRLVKK